MDNVDAATRSKIMRAVHRTDTGPEVAVRHELHRFGFRYRIDVRQLPGSPDLVFSKYHATVFIHGCFWHRHSCRAATMPKSNVEYWVKKFEENKQRDQAAVRELFELGWRVGIVWQCALKRKASIISTVVTLMNWLRSTDKFLEIPPLV